MRLTQISKVLVKHLDHKCLPKTSQLAVRTASFTSIKNPVGTSTPQTPDKSNFATSHFSENESKHSTVDSDDVKLHTDQLKIWWDPQGKMKALHAMNLVRIPFIRDGLVSEMEPTCQPLTGKKILDIGCGGGILSEGLARLGAEVTGIDASEELIGLAKSHSNIDPKIANNKPKYIFTTVEDHVKTHEGYYDGVVASEVIEHVNNKDLFVQASVNALKTGGRIFFTTPNRTRVSQICGIFVAENILQLLPRGTHQYEKFITPPELSFMLERNNCHVESVQGLFYQFMTNHWEWVNTQAFVFALQARKLETTENTQ